MFPQVGGDVPRPQVVKIARLPAADDSYRFALEEIVLGVNLLPHISLESKNEGEKPHPFWIFNSWDFEIVGARIRSIASLKVLLKHLFFSSI